MPESPSNRPTPFAFHVMAKPTGALCNLRCAYCFYLEKEGLYPGKGAPVMSDAVLEAHVRDYIAAHDAPEVTFAWQGGEPTAAGLDFFRRAVALQREHAGGRTIHNTFQTNGILVDDEWAAFFKEQDFLVGLSLDGPQEVHDAYRLDARGKGTHDRVMRALECLKRHEVEFNTLTCVHHESAARPLEVYRFLRRHGSGHMQFIPIVERIPDAPDPDGLTLSRPGAASTGQVAPWCPTPEEYGRFLTTIYDEWVREDVGRVYVQLFEVTLEAWMGMPPSLCLFREHCGFAMALERNGDLYACDHYVYPEYRLGNILETNVRELAASEAQTRFGRDKADTLPGYCRECPVHFVCRGECPKHRFTTAPTGEPGLNYLCAGYRRFFTHVAPSMRFMAGELRAQRPPANVMEWVRRQEREAPPAAGPNDPCPCGSGRKYKKCCGGRQ